MADAMCHSQNFWKHLTFGSSEFHVQFTLEFPEGLEIMAVLDSSMPYIGSKMSPTCAEDFIPRLWYCWETVEV